MTHLFSYQAADRSGKIQTGTRSGESKADVIRELKAEGLFIIKIYEKKEHMTLIGKKVKKTELMAFTRQLAGLLGSGLQIDQAISLVATILGKTRLAQIAFDLKKMVQEGASFSQALERYEAVFGRFYVTLVKAGEKIGLLPEVLKRLSTSLEEEHELKSELTNSLIYPVLVTLVSAIATFVMIRVVVPSFAQLFARSGQELPRITRLVLVLSDILPYLSLFIIMGVVGFIFWYCSGLQSTKAKMVWDRFQLAIPVVGSIRLRLGIARFARMLSLLLQSGVQLVEGMAILQGVLDNLVLSELLHEAELEVRKGGSLARCFGRQAQWPALVKQMVMIGEEAGNLDEMLAHLAHFYEQETRSELKNLMALLGPVLILILTGLVFLIIVAILFPIINVPLLD